MSALRDLFQCARASVSEADIREHSPGDPGYGDYIHAWTAVLRSEVIPPPGTFAFDEPIALSRVDFPRLGEGYRRYRVLVWSVALAWIPGDATDDFAPNEVVAILLDNAFALEDLALVTLLRPALEVVHDAMATRGHEELAFVSLALAILADDIAEGERLAERVLDEEQASRDRGNTHDRAFLWGLTYFDGQRRLWERLVRDHLRARARLAVRVATIRAG
jgi:hypothetical protein